MLSEFRYHNIHWNGRVKKFVLDTAEHLIEDRRMVFVVQSQMFLTYTQPSRTVCVIVSSEHRNFEAFRLYSK